MRTKPTAVTDPLRVGDRLGFPRFHNDPMDGMQWATITGIDIDAGDITVDAGSSFVCEANIRLREAFDSISAFEHNRLGVWLDLHKDYGVRTMTGNGQVGLGHKAMKDLQALLKSAGPYAQELSFLDPQGGKKNQ